MVITIERCSPGRLGELERLLQLGFASLGGRALGDRFPHAFAPGREPLVALGSDGAILGVTATRPFTWQADGEEYKGLMVGLVFTIPAARGAGIARRLVGTAADKGRASGRDFAVLWAARRTLYARLGWSMGDTGVVADVDGSGDSGAQELDDELVTRLEHIRGSISSDGVRREPRDWLAVPPPALSVEAHVRGERAYALVGRRGGQGFVYEMAGDPAGFHDVWASVLSSHDRLVVNDHRGSPTCRWLERECGVRFRPRPLAMWRALSPSVGDVAARSWHVPWLDRL
jgi:GNAT superfamily N-acetyltransferase